VSTAVSGALTAPTAAVPAAALTTAAMHQQTSLRDSCRASQQPWGVTGTSTTAGQQQRKQSSSCGLPSRQQGGRRGMPTLLQS
jgi:hypothetical protein